MPLEPQKPTVTPNAVYIPQLILQTGIYNGVLTTSCQVVYTQAYVDENGLWQQTGISNATHIPNVLVLPEDLVHLQSEVNQMYAIIIDLVGDINLVRKVV